MTDYTEKLDSLLDELSAVGEHIRSARQEAHLDFPKASKRDLDKAMIRLKGISEEMKAAYKLAEG